MGPMFFTIREQSFSAKDKRNLDQLETQNMEDELKASREEKLKRERDQRAATEEVSYKSKIVTPGFKRPATGKREIGTPRVRPRIGF